MTSYRDTQIYGLDDIDDLDLIQRLFGELKRVQAQRAIGRA
jgi:hypothetical protein